MRVDADEERHDEQDDGPHALDRADLVDALGAQVDETSLDDARHEEPGRHVQTEVGEEGVELAQTLVVEHGEVGRVDVEGHLQPVTDADEREDDAIKRSRHCKVHARRQQMLAGFQ